MIEIGLAWCSGLGFVEEGGKDVELRERERAEKWLEAQRQSKNERQSKNDKNEKDSKNKKKRKQLHLNKKII